MDMLLTFAAATGLAAHLLQTKPLPSDADLISALKKLDQNPDDPEANLTAGKYKAFVLGDYPEGMVYLAKGSDKTLKTLAQHELDPSLTGSLAQKVAMGDEWVTATKKFPPLFRIFFDRASHWYVAAWPDADPVWKDKLREQGKKLSAARPPGSPRKLPSKWAARVASPVLDGTVSRTGSYSLRVPHGDPKIRPSETQAWSEPIPMGAGKKIDFTAYVRSEETNSAEDQVYLLFFDRADAIVHGIQARVPADLPFWNRLTGKADIPLNAQYARIGVANRSAQGQIWADDLSVRIDGQEALKNPSFEEK